MEIDGQNAKEQDDEKADENFIEKSCEDLAGKILYARTENSVLREASKQIEDLTKANLPIFSKETEPTNILNNNTENEINIKTQEKTDLQKQVQTGEVTPFEAVEKHTASQAAKGTENKSTHLLNLEKYLRQQAELAQQRRHLKKTSKDSHKETEQVLPNKKTKLSNVNSRTRIKSERIKSNNAKKKSALEADKPKDSVDTENNSSTIDIIKLNQSEDKTRNSKGIPVSLNVSKDNTGDSAYPTNEENDSGSDYVPSDDQAISDEECPTSSRKKRTSGKSLIARAKRILDDGDEDIYRQRVVETGYRKNEAVHKIDNLFKVPLSIWKKLYKYQKVSIQWLWELHGRNLGGLLGDEMGLGKTVQVIAFLAGLDYSELLSDGGRFRGLGPTIIVCPATLMEQWVKHFHEWWPTLRIVVLHQSGTYNGDVEYLLHSLKSGGILVTSYSGMLRHKDILVAMQWHYVILDEGHKIRNPQAKVSKAVKEFSTPHRLLLTGSPMQNSLKELWSLFDFILPGKLGTLSAFLEHCASPITRGGYANATPLQEATALQVATMLRDAITPYMLRRTKADVQHHVFLPEKNEQVLFCSLTDEQKKLYKKYLRSEDVSFVLHEKNNHSETGRYRARLLIALSALRKICNHPDLFIYTSQLDSDEDIDLTQQSLDKFGYWKRAGKMTVVRSLLKIWKRQGHRVLLFTQGRQMMHILESLVQSENFSYLRMDGTTPMSQRQQTIRLFNDNQSYFIFLLTTRVGGLGVNLTGANRVIIYDPDWNPATDAQARERAWRIGQSKQVTIYRLITAGTIEEKMYHRQIFKVLLSNKVLEDPRQRRLFKTSDLAELFNLNEPIDGKSSESDRLFRDSKLTPTSTKFSSSKIEKMRKLAATLSKSISKNVSSTSAKSTASEETDTSTNEIPSATITENVQKPKIEKESLNVNEDVMSDVQDTNNVELKSNATVEKNDVINTNEMAPLETSENTLEDNMLLEALDKVEFMEKDTEATVIKSKETETELNKGDRTHKRNKKSSRSEKKSVSAIFEGERISCLIGRRLGTSKTEDPTPTEDDQYVLKKLFAKSNISSAFQHEAVLANNGCNSEDKTPMYRLARETAQESMECVRKSRKWCWKPTWDLESSRND